MKKEATGRRADEADTGQKNVKDTLEHQELKNIKADFGTFEDKSPKN